MLHTPSSTETSARISAKDVADGLAGRVHELVREILPEGKKRGQEWVCGSVAGEAGSSLSVHLSGARAGVWADFATQEAGDALDLVAACLFGGQRKDAYRWGLRWLGYGGGPSGTMTRPVVDPRREEERKRREAYELEQRITAARRVFFSAVPLCLDDPVLSYLEGRGIGLTPGRYPQALRYHRALWCRETNDFKPAMVAAITTVEGRLVAVHQTFLECVEGRWVKARVQRCKKILGAFSGHMIRLAPGKSGTPLKKMHAHEEIIIGEGIETCLSVAMQCPEYRVLCAGSLYNMNKITLPQQAQKIILLADNDEGNVAAQNAFTRAVNSLQARHMRVKAARAPWGKDFNDTLQKMQASP